MCRSIRLCLLTVVFYVVTVGSVEGGSLVNSGVESPVFETVHTSNAALFNRLGLSPLRISQGHHKKRLAGPEPSLNFASQNHQAYGRRHGHRDSHVYIVKLPASLPYYAITRPHKETAKNEVKGVVKGGGNHPVGFQSNGKPGGIYHWNLPVMKKMAEKKRLVEHRMHLIQQQQQRQQQQQQQQEKKEKPIVEENSNEVSIPNTGGTPDSGSTIKTDEKKETPSNLDIREKHHFRSNDKRLNYVLKNSSDMKSAGTSLSGNKVKHNNKNYRLDDSPLYKVKLGHNEHRLIWNALNDPHNSMYGNSMKQKKHRKKSAMSYYAPFSLKSGSTNLQKNFSGNGKPKAFYVIEKSRKPAYYHPLLP